MEVPVTPQVVKPFNTAGINRTTGCSLVHIALYPSTSLTCYYCFVFVYRIKQSMLNRPSKAGIGND